ncbi:hypothetical protein BH20ACT24_BH20ACT24_15970 [soil metagenome]
MGTIVYVDAFNLYYGALKGTRFKWLDLDAFCRRLLPRDQVTRVRYFTAHVSARPGDPQQPQRQLTYIRALETIPHLSVHLGHYLTHATRMPLANPAPGQPNTVEVIKTEEKGSDVNIATYLMLDACRGGCDTAVVISNDSDLKEPVAVARSEFGLKVGVVNPHPPARRSRALQPSFFKQLRKGTLAACQFPVEITDAQGTFRKPANW